MGALQKLVETELSLNLVQAGLPLVHQGKVRDTWGLPDADALLQVVTDRVSIFDHVLPCRIPGKGKILAKLTVFWLNGVLRDIPHHLLVHGKDIDQYLPESLRNNPELQTRALVVRKLSMLPVEGIARGYLTGSGWRSYQESGEICGIRLPPSLHDGAKLAFPIFTPTTKAPTGHDQPLDISWVRRQYPSLEPLTLEIYQKVAEYAELRGIILADTKFEFGWWKGQLLLGDEVGTPDSSRFWKKEEWEEWQLKEERSPPNYDKQVLRDWGKTIGIDKLDPANPEHIAYVHSLTVPEEILALTAERYQEIIHLLTT